MIYSGGLKGYPIWFASENFPEISRRGTKEGMHLHISKNSVTFPVVS